MLRRSVICAKKSSVMDTKNKNIDKRQIAQTLFLNGQSFKDIAATLGVNEHTVSRWAKAANWEALKTNLLTGKQQRLSELYNELKEFNRMIADKQGYKVADAREADARRKLITDIRDLESSFSIAQAVTIGQDFCDFVKALDYDLAKKVVDYYHAFLNDQIEKRKWQDD